MDSTCAKRDSEFDKDLSQMITLDDINGDIHMHTTYSDGAYSIRDMIEANIKKAINLW